MRILYFLRTLTAGGVEPHLMTLGRGLMARGCQVAVASDGGIGNHSHGIDWFEKSGFEHFTIGFPRPKDRAVIPLRAASSMRSLSQAVRRFRPDVIHVHYRATSIYAGLLQSLWGVPFVSTLHMTGIPCSPLHRLASFWGQRAIAISTEVKEYLEGAFGVDSRRIRLVHNGADDTRYRRPTPAERAAARDAFGLAPDTKVIAMVARMEYEKGHDVLLDAMASLRDRGQRTVALMAGVSIAGHMAWRDEVLRRAERLGLSDSVRLLGFTDSRSVFWASDVSVLPSRQEGFPMAVVEAMLCGLAPIRTPAAGARDQIIDRESGYIVPFDDSGALADRLGRVLSGDEAARRMAAAAEHRARQSFSADGMVGKTLGVYEEAVGRRN